MQWDSACSQLAVGEMSLHWKLHSATDSTWMFSWNWQARINKCHLIPSLTWWFTSLISAGTAKCTRNPSAQQIAWAFWSVRSEYYYCSTPDHGVASCPEPKRTASPPKSAERVTSSPSTPVVNPSQILTVQYFMLNVQIMHLEQVVVLPALTDSIAVGNITNTIAPTENQHNRWRSNRN